MALGGDCGLGGMREVEQKAAMLEMVFVTGQTRNEGARAERRGPRTAAMADETRRDETRQDKTGLDWTGLAGLGKLLLVFLLFLEVKVGKINSGAGLDLDLDLDLGSPCPSDLTGPYSNLTATRQARQRPWGCTPAPQHWPRLGCPCLPAYPLKPPSMVHYGTFLPTWALGYRDRPSIASTSQARSDPCGLARFLVEPEFCARVLSLLWYIKLFDWVLEYPRYLVRLLD